MKRIDFERHFDELPDDLPEATIKLYDALTGYIRTLRDMATSDEEFEAPIRQLMLAEAKLWTQRRDELDETGVDPSLQGLLPHA